MSDTKHTSRGYLLGILAAIFCVFAALLLFFNRQYIVDQLSVWQYHPSSEVSVLVDHSGMGAGGKFFFYATQPAVENATDFNKQCDRKENSTAILGCYNGRNIFIYNVTDVRLDGIKEVTAAHEMLHAAYSRMSDSERKSVDVLLEAEYNKLKDNKDFSDRMAFYARTEPGERDNELHSVIGTEVADISPELENHYREFFTDRSKVVALHAKYASVFAGLQSKATALVAQLKKLGDKIISERAQYEMDRTRLDTDIESFNKQTEVDGFSSRGTYENELATLNGRITDFNQFRTNIEADITSYQSLQQELTSVASQSQDLTRSIDSSLAPAPSL